MIEIKLQNRNWFYDDGKPLGEPGGFGQVFEGKSNKRKKVAIKRLKVEAEEVGHRELQLADDISRLTFDHVISIYDYGIDAESGRYFIVMEMAEYSLHNYLEREKKIGEIQAIDIVSNIVNGLKELKGIVHRDLKPANIFFNEGKWKIADFGIARFVEESTSLNTLKECLSPHYAAPEQWRLETVTKATDIYAVGIIAHEILTGSPPFDSERLDQLRDLHLNSHPPSLSFISAKFRQIIMLSLRKSPESRPSVESLQKQIENIKEKNSYDSKIAEAGAKVAEKLASEEAEKIKIQTKEQKRKQLAQDAFESLRFILNELFQYIKNEASVAKMYGSEIRLGDGKITVNEKFKYIPEESFSSSKMDIVCGAIIKVTQDPRIYKGRASNLWYMKRGESYRWVEIAYRTLSYQHKELEPFAIESENEFEDADYAASNTMHTVSHAFTPKFIDAEHMNEFVLRWADRLASASTNNLGRPMRLPED